MPNPAKVKVSVESQNPTLAFFKDGNANPQSSLVNVGNEFKIKKYIQNSVGTDLQDVMTVNEDGAVKFHKNVTFAGDAVVQNVQSIIMQDQKLEIGTTDANQVNSSGVFKVAGATSYSIGVTSNTDISTSTDLLFGKYDLVNGPVYPSANSTDNVSTITSGNFTKVGSSSLSSTVNILPTDSTLTSDLKVYEKKTRFDQEVTNLSIIQNTLTITYSTSSNTNKLEDLVIGQLLAIDYNSNNSNAYKDFIFNRIITNIYGIITNINTTAKTITLKYTNKNMNGSQNGSGTEIGTNLYFTPGTLITNVLGIFAVNAPSTYKFNATDSNVDFTTIYSVGNFVHFEGLKCTIGGNPIEIFNRSHPVSAVGTSFITIRDPANYEVADFSGSAVFVSKLQSITDETGISLIGNAMGMYVKGSLAFDNNTNKNLKLENTAGPISVGSDWSSFPVNIGTQGNRAITIGNNMGGILAINSGNGATINTANNSNISFTTTNTADTVITTGQLLVSAKDNVTDAILLKADNGANQTININNQTGTSADAIKLASDLGGVQITAANEKDVVIGNSGSNVFVKVSPSATNANEKISVVNTNGTDEESILLKSEAGGAKFKVANGKNLFLGNSSENLFVKLSPNSVVSNEKLSIVNTYGSGDESILLNSVAGGAKFLVADSKNLVLGNSNEDIYFKVSPSATTANEKLSVVNSNGTAADSIFINSVSGGLTMNCGGSINLATNNNTSAVNIGTLGDRTITIGDKDADDATINIDSKNVVFANGLTSSSDIRLKENFESIPNALELVKQLNSFYYTWKKDAGTVKPRKIGFIAQEVEKVIPELVKTDSEGMKSVDYVSVVPVLVEALKHQQKQIDELKASLHV
jgi:hypothetical protein